MVLNSCDPGTFLSSVSLYQYHPLKITSRMSNSSERSSKKKPPNSFERDIRKMRKSNYLKERPKLFEIEKSFGKDITYIIRKIRKTSCN